MRKMQGERQQCDSLERGAEHCRNKHENTIAKGLAEGRFGSLTYEELCVRFLCAVASGSMADEARQALLWDTSGIDSSVFNEDCYIIIGGLRLPVKENRE